MGLRSTISAISTTPATLGSEPSAERQRTKLLQRHLSDSIARSRGTSVVYLPLWLLVSIAGGLWPLSATVVAWNTFAFLGLSVVRIALAAWAARAVERSPKGAHGAFCVAVLGPSTYWGVLSGASLMSSWGDQIWWAMLVIAVGTAIAGSAVLAMNPLLRLAMPASVLAPMAWCVLISPTETNFLVAALAIAAAVFGWRLSSTLNKDYQDALVARFSAESEALEFKRRSVTDPLTSIPNRSAFDQAIRRYWELDSAAEIPLAVLMIDLDHFKSVNDTYGHQVGDMCLKAAASALTSSVRRTGDAVFRVGGEEFAAIVVDSTTPEVLAVAERCLQHVREIQLQVEGVDIHLTCSIGVAMRQASVEGCIEDLIREADEALYRAKSAGRARVSL